MTFALAIVLAALLSLVLGAIAWWVTGSDIDVPEYTPSHCKQFKETDK